MLLLDDDGTEEERASCWLRMDGVIGVDPVAWIVPQWGSNDEVEQRREYSMRIFNLSADGFITQPHVRDQFLVNPAAREVADEILLLVLDQHCCHCISSSSWFWGISFLMSLSKSEYAIIWSRRSLIPCAIAIFTSRKAVALAPKSRALALEVVLSLLLVLGLWELSL